MAKRIFARRLFIKAWVLGAAGLGVRATATFAAAPTRLDVTDPAATALGYVENASQVDRQKYKSYVKGSNCDNCLQLQGTAGDNYRPCSLFPGKLVSVSGWCSGWTAEM